MQLTEVNPAGAEGKCTVMVLPFASAAIDTGTLPPAMHRIDSCAMPTPCPKRRAELKSKVAEDWPAVTAALMVARVPS